MEEEELSQDQAYNSLISVTRQYVSNNLQETIQIFFTGLSRCDFPDSERIIELVREAKTWHMPIFDDMEYLLSLKHKYSITETDMSNSITSVPNRNSTHTKKNTFAIFVGNLEYSTTLDEFSELLKTDGLQSCKMSYNKESKRFDENKGFGFGFYNNVQHQYRAIQDLNGTMYKGRRLHVDEKKQRMKPWYLYNL